MKTLLIRIFIAMLLLFVVSTLMIEQTNRHIDITDTVLRKQRIQNLYRMIVPGRYEETFTTDSYLNKITGWPFSKLKHTVDYIAVCRVTAYIDYQKIDLKKDLIVENDAITLTLPPVEYTCVRDVEKSFMWQNDFEKYEKDNPEYAQIETIAAQKAQEKALTRALEKGIEEKAYVQAERYFTRLFTGLGFKEVKVFRNIKIKNSSSDSI